MMTSPIHANFRGAFASKSFRKPAPLPPPALVAGEDVPTTGNYREATMEIGLAQCAG